MLEEVKRQIWNSRTNWIIDNGIDEFNLDFMEAEGDRDYYRAYNLSRTFVKKENFVDKQIRALFNRQKISWGV